MNHSPRPNCHETGVQTITSRDIEAGEELTCDYRTFDHEALDHPID
jgi:SET domain-containing protein